MPRRRTIVAAATAALTALLILPMPSGAHAATGQFVYFTGTGWGALTNPTNGQCYLWVGDITRVMNSTDTRASLYASQDCTGKAVTVTSGQGAAYQVSDPYNSIKFG